jgi:hypothetical protein
VTPFKIDTAVFVSTTHTHTHTHYISVLLISSSFIYLLLEHTQRMDNDKRCIVNVIKKYIFDLLK